MLLPNMNRYKGCRSVLLCIYIFSALAVFPQSREMLDYKELASRPASELLRTADRYYGQNDYDTAMGYYIVLAGRYNTDADKGVRYLCVLAYIQAANIYITGGNYLEAFNFLMKAMKICSQNGFVTPLSKVYLGLGNVYGSFSDYGAGIFCYKKGLTISRILRDTVSETQFLNKIFGLSCYAGRTEEARKYYGEMNKNMYGDPLRIYFSHFNLALIKTNEHQYDSAVACYRAAARHAADVSLEFRYVKATYYNLAILFEKMGRADSSAIYYSRCIELSRKDGNKDMLYYSMKALSRIYRDHADVRAASYEKEFRLLSDSIFNADQFNRMKNAQFVHEIDKSYREIESLNVEKQRKDAELLSQRRKLIFISVTLIVILFLLVWGQLQKRKLHVAYKDLFKRNAEIIESEREGKIRRAEYEQRLAGELEENIRLRALLEEKTVKSLSVDTESGIGECDMEENLKKVYSVDRLTDIQKETLLREVTRVMEDTSEFCNCDFGLERLAGLIGSNIRYVSQVINDAYHKNFRTYLNEYRVREAQLRMMDTEKYGNYTIKAIAESVGYKSQPNFIAIFKKMTGISPSIYQKMAKEAEKTRICS